MAKAQKDPSEALADKCLALPWKACLKLYSELLAESPRDCAFPAFALREKARSGELPDEAIGVLVVALVDAPNNPTITHLAKALAAFGRKAQSASPYLIEKIQTMPVTHDIAFWNYDGCLHALSYLGGKAAGAFFDELEAMDPSPVLRSKSVYDGQIPNGDRQKMFEKSMARCRGRLESEDPGTWSKKLTDLQAVDSEKKEALKPWMTRR
jgi:hypothetical protein